MQFRFDPGDFARYFFEECFCFDFFHLSLSLISGAAEKILCCCCWENKHLDGASLKLLCKQLTEVVRSCQVCDSLGSCWYKGFVSLSSNNLSEKILTIMLFYCCAFFIFDSIVASKIHDTSLKFCVLPLAVTGFLP